MRYNFNWPVIWRNFDKLYDGLLLGLLIDAHKKAQTSFVYSDFIQEKPPVTEERASAKPVQ